MLARRKYKGRWITRVLPESTALRLQGRKPDEIWDMGKGRKILVCDMELKHLMNAIKFVEAKAINLMKQASIDTEFGNLLARHLAVNRVVGKEYPAYLLMLRELDARLHPKPKTEEVKHERAFQFED